VAIPAVLAGPQKALAVLEEIKVVADVDPIGIIFTEGGAGLAVAASAISRSSVVCVR